MNPLLQVKLRFSKESNTQRPNGRNLRSAAETSVEAIDSLSEDLRAVLRYYRSTPKILKDILVDVHYNDIIAKSNRIQEVLKPSRKSTNDCIVGARFSNAPEGEENHIITYYVSQDTIERTLVELDCARRFLVQRLNGKATATNFKESDKTIVYDGFGLSKKKMRGIIIDCSVIESFSVPQISSIPSSDTFLVTFYKTELQLANILEKLGVDDARFFYSFYGDDTISLTRDLLDILEEKIPYLISMISSDFSKVTLDEIDGVQEKEEIEIPKPQNEPIIGVIDTLFDESVYFNSWVENIDYLEDFEQLLYKDAKREHGTEVTSILVDGPRMNPWLDDGCGRFRVRHFGVCEDKISTARLVRKIREIVDRNPDIHVWNISLGTEDEVSKNFISYDAAVLDDLQAKKNILFVISGTNDDREERSGILRIGSPADSLNSIVVNSVRRDGRPVSYSRKGNVLSFFNKPDISYYGGDYDDRIIAYSPKGAEPVYGTSFAAPWISRKLCYLIDIVGLPREVAKALLIDSAAGWDYKQLNFKNKDIMGYGIVPISISDILQTESDEIRFVVYGSSESYRTANYAIPVPTECTRSQGVDYTDRELSLKFGRINAKGSIDDINDNVQDDEGAHVDERQSRREFRKWENTKFISKLLGKNRAIKSYDDRAWGITITSKERLSTRTGTRLNFGAVITLREINGINRIQEFVRACTFRGWIVNEVNVQNQIEVYNVSQEEIRFD